MKKTENPSFILGDSSPGAQNDCFETCSSK